MGSANLSDNGNGTATLTCPGSGTCYETDDHGNTGPGAHILIHMGAFRIAATVVSAAKSNINGDETPEEANDKLPSTLFVQADK